jgi:AcrR family transcriptional regulator
MPKVVPQYTDDAKRRIVQAAMEAMAERGYNNVTVDDVARKIGVTISPEIRPYVFP